MKKFFTIAISLLLVLCLVGCEERFDPAPQITEGEFPFLVEYEMNGERYIIEDTVVCSFAGFDSATNNFRIFGYPSKRAWTEYVKNEEEGYLGIILLKMENTESVFVQGRKNYRTEVYIDYGTAEYYMGDTEAEYNYSEPSIMCHEVYYNEEMGWNWDGFTELTNEQLEEYFGIKIIRFLFSQPIENKFE